MCRHASNGMCVQEVQEIRECERLEARCSTLQYALTDREWRSAQQRIDDKRAEASQELRQQQGHFASNQFSLGESPESPDVCNQREGKQEDAQKTSAEDVGVALHSPLSRGCLHACACVDLEAEPGGGRADPTIKEKQLGESGKEAGVRTDLAFGGFEEVLI
eukprot:s9485_g1.t1